MLGNLKVEANSDDLLDDDYIGILNILEKLVFFILQSWQLDDANNSISILFIQLGDKDRICLSCLPFCFKNFALFGLDQLLGITPDFVFTDDDIIFN